MEMLLVFIYLAIGVILSLYWFKHDYGEEYEEFEEYDAVEKDTAMILMSFMALIWPLRLIIRYGKYIIRQESR
jgi:hypothetical protein